MAKSYKLTANTRFGAAGETVTEQHLKDNGADIADLKGRGLVESVGRDEGDDEGRVTDEANKLKIEQRIRDETARLNRPLQEHEKVNIEREVSADSAAQTRDAQKTDASDQRAANKGSGDGTKAPKAGNR